MKEVSPAKVLEEVSNDVPAESRKNIIVIGSLAAGYHFFGADEKHQVRTKDVDCLLSPRAEAAVSGRAMARRLLALGWNHRIEGGFGRPQDSPTPLDRLSAIRLHPPGSDAWFIELLTVPESEDDHGKGWIPVQLDEGYFGLCSFEFLSLLAQDPHMTPFGIRYARPEMMALANLLSHRVIAPETMSSPFEGREIKRSNKDLGRVLALARLSGDEDVESWPAGWAEALLECFPSRWPQLARSAGDGLKALLASEDDLEEALHTCNAGLLARGQIRLDQLRATGERLLRDAIEPLAELADDPASDG